MFVLYHHQEKHGAWFSKAPIHAYQAGQSLHVRGPAKYTALAYVAVLFRHALPPYLYSRGVYFNETPDRISTSVSQGEPYPLPKSPRGKPNIPWTHNTKPQNIYETVRYPQTSIECGVSQTAPLLGAKYNRSRTTIITYYQTR